MPHLLKVPRPLTHNVKVELCGSNGGDHFVGHVSKLHHVDKCVVIVWQGGHDVLLEAADGCEVRLVLEGGREGGRERGERERGVREGGREGGREGARGREDCKGKLVEGRERMQR